MKLTREIKSVSVVLTFLDVLLCMSFYLFIYF